MIVVDGMMRRNPQIKVAVIDKDDPGGICLTRGCIPSKILLYPAELIRTIESAAAFGISVNIKGVDFSKVMGRMTSLIDHDINQSRQGLTESLNIDYYHVPAEFVGEYTLKVDNQVITSKMIILGIGSRPLIPPIVGLETVGYHTSDTVLYERKLPSSIVNLKMGDEAVLVANKMRPFRAFSSTQYQFTFCLSLPMLAV